MPVHDVRLDAKHKERHKRERSIDFEPSRTLSRILLIRGQRVMLDADLAEVYGTTTKALNQAVGRGHFKRALTLRSLFVDLLRARNLRCSANDGVPVANRPDHLALPHH